MPVPPSLSPPSETLPTTTPTTTTSPTIPTTTTSPTIPTTTTTSPIPPSSYSVPTSTLGTFTQVQLSTTFHSTTLVIYSVPNPSSSTLSSGDDKARDKGPSQGSGGLETKDIVGIVFGIVGAAAGVMGVVLGVLQYKSRGKGQNQAQDTVI